MFCSFKVHDALENENDDIDGSGSGYGGDDEDDDIPTSAKDKPHIKPDSPTNNLHHSGDGSDHRIDTDDDTDDKFHEDHTKPLHNVDEDDDNLYFDNNSTDTDKTVNPTTTDDEDSQLIYLYYLLLFAYVILFSQFSLFGIGVFQTFSRAMQLFYFSILLNFYLVP